MPPEGVRTWEQEQRDSSHSRNIPPDAIQKLKGFFSGALICKLTGIWIHGKGDSWERGNWAWSGQRLRGRAYGILGSPRVNGSVTLLCDCRFRIYPPSRPPLGPKPAYRGTQPAGLQSRHHAGRPGLDWGHRHGDGHRAPPAAGHTLGSSCSHPAPGALPVGIGVVARGRCICGGTTGHRPAERGNREGHDQGSHGHKASTQHLLVKLASVGSTPKPQRLALTPNSVWEVLDYKHGLRLEL